MNTVREIPWPRILAEGLAIVVSILLAFWIQAWWEGRQEQSHERIVLQSLLDDLNKKKAQLIAERRDVQAIYESATALLRAATDTEQEFSSRHH